MKKGISLIVLVITIIVIIILATAVILSVISNNPIGSAKKAQFLGDLETFKNELFMYQTSKIADTKGEYIVEGLFADNTHVLENRLDNTSKSISDIVTTMKGTRYMTLFVIYGGTLIYVGEDEDEIRWSTENNLQVGVIKVDVNIDKNEIDRTLTVNINVANAVSSIPVEEDKIDGYNVYISNNNQFVDTIPVELPGKKSNTSYTKTDIEVQKEYYVKAEVIMSSKVYASTTKETKIEVVNDGIVSLVRNTNLADGNYEIESNGMVYNVEVYNFYDNTTYTSDPVLGDEVADQSMLILKYHKDLIIENGVILTPQVRKKGTLICVNGTLTNNGKISMTARGAITVGDNVYLWKNTDGSYETIPAIGGIGALALKGQVHGVIGGVAPNRGTGGGGSGASMRSATKGGNGATGTSYSGGSGRRRCVLCSRFTCHR